MSLHGLTPESAAVVKQVAGSVDPLVTEPTIAERRAALYYMAHEFGPPLAPVRTIEEHQIDCQSHVVDVRVYYPVEQRSGGHIIVQLHGGGWALGGPDTYERQSRAICNATQTVLVDVDYRLAPENKYPAAVEDCEAAGCWSLNLARSLGLRSDRLVVVGDSAGGYLAALFCQRNPEIVAGQVLIYPVLTVGRKNDFPSREQLGSGNYFLTFDAITNAEVEFFADVGVAGADGPSPLLAPDEMLARSPKSLIILAEKDPLIQEGLEFGRKLERAGVQVKTLVEKGTIHAFILFAGAISAGEKYFCEVGRFVRSLSDQTSN